MGCPHLDSEGLSLIHESRYTEVANHRIKALVEEEWQHADVVAAGTLTLVYDHHKNDLARKLTRMQHDDHDIIITTLHVHLDHHNCLEVLVLKGDAGRVRALADRLVSCKGVKHGTFSGTTTGQDLA